MSVNPFITNKTRYSYRCIIPIKPENIGTWLNPEASSLDAMYAILDDKDRPYYEHKLAA